MKIYIATHKAYEMPEDKIYVPIHAGKKIHGNIGYFGDDNGYSISEKNKNYSELTALYWIWKNSKEDYVGLVHYRRYFTNKKGIQTYLNRDIDFIKINEKEIRRTLKKYDIIVPRKVRVEESIYKNYESSHFIKDLILTKNIIKDKYPKFIKSFDKVLNGNKMNPYNMFITRKEIIDSYCEWLFDILFELERKLDISSYDEF